ncbi:MAG: nuclear transport factor 2 family protein [Lachnospiraceae bacterium]|nr:nuclear transport factor 2 family protein [Lachnospiraceae bacterium]
MIKLTGKPGAACLPAVLVLIMLFGSVVLSSCSSVTNVNETDSEAFESTNDTGIITEDFYASETTTSLQVTEEADMETRRVIERYQAVQQAMIDKDIETLDKIILDGTTFTHMSGKTQTKEEYFADIRDGRLDYQSYTMTDEQVVISGDDATLTCHVVLTANAYGAQGSWPFDVTAHLVRINGEWYLTN